MLQIKCVMCIYVKFLNKQYFVIMSIVHTNCDDKIASFRRHYSLEDMSGVYFVTIIGCVPTFLSMLLLLWALASD